MDSRLNDIKKHFEGYHQEPRAELWDSIFDEVKKDNALFNYTGLKPLFSVLMLGLIAALVVFSTSLNPFGGNENPDKKRSIAFPSIEEKDQRATNFGAEEYAKSLETSDKVNLPPSKINTNQIANFPEDNNDLELNESSNLKIDNTKNSYSLLEEEVKLAPIKVTTDNPSSSKGHDAVVNDSNGSEIANDKPPAEKLLKTNNFLNEFAGIASLNSTVIKDNISLKDIEILVSKPHSKKFSFALSYGADQLTYCQNHKANNTYKGLELNYHLNKNLKMVIGARLNTLTYQFDFTEEMKSFYRTRNKYPEVFRLFQDIQSISNHLDFFSLNFGLDYELLSLNRHHFGVGINQELILKQSQELAYDLGESVNFRVGGKETSLVLGRLEPSFNYNYSLNRNFELGLSVTYSYYQNFIGFEKEKYSGIGVNLHASYTLF
jgi:hypothetical protein